MVVCDFPPSDKSALRLKNSLYFDPSFAGRHQCTYVRATCPAGADKMHENECTNIFKIWYQPRSGLGACARPPVGEKHTHQRTKVSKNYSIYSPAVARERLKLTPPPLRFETGGRRAKKNPLACSGQAEGKRRPLASPRYHCAPSTVHLGGKG